MQVYIGIGNTKKIAKQMAAERAVRSLIQFRRESGAVGQLDLATKSSAFLSAAARHRSLTVYRPRPQLHAAEDFTSDDTEGVAVLFQSFDELTSDGDSGCQSPTSRSIEDDDDVRGSGDFDSRRRCRHNFETDITNEDCGTTMRYAFYDNRRSVGNRPWITAGLRSSPAAILNDLRPGVEYQVMSRDEVVAGVERTEHDDCQLQRPSSEQRVPGRTGYVASITVDGRQFIGYGRTKRSAKRRAATEALRTVFLLRHLV